MKDQTPDTSTGEQKPGTTTNTTDETAPADVTPDSPVESNPDDFDAPAGATAGDENEATFGLTPDKPTGTSSAAPAQPNPLAPIADDADIFTKPASATTDDPEVSDDVSAGDELMAALEAMASRVTKWDVVDYLAAGVEGFSAKKLSDSFVAPLVAAARGYRSFNSSTFNDIGQAFGAVDKRNKQMRRVADAADRADVMLMPWFAADSVVAAAARVGGAKHDSVQFRPGKLPPEIDGVKQRKYEFLTGDQTPIAVHPSFPITWIDDCPTVLLAEGLLKGDAAITGYLIDAGYTKADLSYRGDVDARETLRALFAAIPAEKQLLILTMAGVWNWQQNHEWNALVLRDREVWLGVDGDVATKPGVYKATDRLWAFLKEKKKAEVKLLAPIIPTENDEGASDEKVGIDDFLADHGTWKQLLDCLSTTMPPKPADLKAAEGDVRIDGDGCSASQYLITEKDAAGNGLDGKWLPLIPLGGRIHSLVADRIPTDAELETGVFGTAVTESGTEWEVEMEITFRNPEGEAESHMIVGPHSILNYLPEKWHDKGAHIPGPVMTHSEWPPRGKVAEQWIRAAKAHRQEAIVSRTRWASMGWVPVPSGIPVYIAGTHVIGGTDVEANDEVIPGVTNLALDRAESFGAGPDSGLTFDSEEYREEVRQAIEAVMETYVFNEVWTDRRNAAVVIASGLRPALPIRPRAIPYFTGSRGTGKTFSAEAAIAFWQSKPGALIPVPGSAKDTGAAMELSVSRSNLWVIDDLAPASSKRQSEDEKDKIGNLIRNHFNGTARARSNANMEARKKNNPRALLILTAENEPTVSSELDRLILCDIGHGALNKAHWPTDRLSGMVENGVSDNPGAPALVSQAMVKYLRWRAAAPGSSWADVFATVKSSLSAASEQALTDMEGKGKRRHAGIAGDLIVVFHWLRQIAEEVNCSEEVMDLFDSLDGLPHDILDLVGQMAQENQGTSPGRALTEALSSVLRRGRAHILNADDPSIEPVDPHSEKAKLRALGWVPGNTDKDAWKPSHGSDPIGWIVEEKGERVIIFDLRVAFSVAQQYSDGLIPHGQGYRSSWASVTGEGFGVKTMLRPTAQGKLINSCRKMTNGTTRTGYPVSLEQVLRGGYKDDEHKDHDSHEEADEVVVE